MQQNSDTTYRVFDWNRLGLDGRLRTLHVEESLQSIDFTDYQPAVAQPRGDTLVECPHFCVEKWTLENGRPRDCCEPGRFAVFSVVEGELECGRRTFRAGDFFLVPATMPHPGSNHAQPARRFFGQSFRTERMRDRSPRRFRTGGTCSPIYLPPLFPSATSAEQRAAATTAVRT